MTRLTATALAVLLAGGALFAQAGSQTTGQTTPPPQTTQKPPATPPATQAPAQTPKPALPPPPAAQQLPFPAGATIAYVQMQAVISTSKFGKCGSDQLNQLRAQHATALTPKQKELESLNQQIQAKQGVVSDAAMLQLTRDRDRVLHDGQAMQQQFQTDEENKNQDLLNDFQGKVIPLLEVLRKEKDLSFILSADMNGAIVAANAALDLTSELVKRLDVAYPDCAKGK